MTTLKSNLSHPKYRPDIDGLRAIAVLSVVFFHAFPSSIRGGFIGVDIFFVISGFLISTIIFESLKRDSFSFAEFYSRRIRRIFPALITVLVCCFGFGFFILSADEFSQLGKHVAAGAGFVSNFVLWSESGYFDSSVETKPLLHLWSLGIEEQFYIFWPLILLFAWKRKINLLMITVVVALMSFTWNAMGIKPDPVATFYSPQTRIWELLCGSILAWLALNKPQLFSQNGQDNSKNKLANVLSITGFLLFIYGFSEITEESSFPGFWALIPVLGTVFIIAAGTNAWLNRKILSNKYVVWFGLISFPLYLWHWPLLTFGRIYYNDTPPSGFRWIAVLLSILFAWLTVKYIEKPFRHSKQRVNTKVMLLCSLAAILGVLGLVIYKTDFSKSQFFETYKIKRKDAEHSYGHSLAWFEGKNDWLFLGNKHEKNVAKLKLSIVPSEQDTEEFKETFEKLAKAGEASNTKVVLFVGPDKPTIYPEYLPDKLKPSEKRYTEFFLNKLKGIPNLTVYDPTEDLRRAKSSEGLLYWRTDTHWNFKGAFVAYSGFSKLLNLPVPQVDFKLGAPYAGDLIVIAKLTEYPMHADDNWDVIWKDKRVWTETILPNEHETPFGHPSIVKNNNPLSDQYIWVVGDSFNNVLKPYFNETFKEVRYVGHWRDKLEGLSSELNRADRKPDMIVVVKVERSF